MKNVAPNKILILSDLSDDVFEKNIDNDKKIELKYTQTTGNSSANFTTELSKKQNILSGSGIIKSISGSISYISGSSSQFVKANGSLDNSVYLTSVTSGNVTTALGYTPYNATNPSEYITTGSLSPYLLSSIASTTYQPIGSYLTSITSGSVITALGYVPYNSSNPSGYISSVPAQSFTSLTGKPSTLGGYGITDAYPLNGNPSYFATTVASGSGLRSVVVNNIPTIYFGEINPTTPNVDGNTKLIAQSALDGWGTVTNFNEFGGVSIETYVDADDLSVLLSGSRNSGNWTYSSAKFSVSPEEGNIELRSNGVDIGGSTNSFTNIVNNPSTNQFYVNFNNNNASIHQENVITQYSYATEVTQPIRYTGNISNITVSSINLIHKGYVDGNFLNISGGNLVGVSGSGSIGYKAQNVKPSTPSTGFKLYANSTNALSWIGANGFTRTFDGTANTADRTYTLPNSSGTIPLLEATQTWSSSNTWSNLSIFNGSSIFNGTTTLNSSVTLTGTLIQSNGLTLSSGTNPLIKPTNAVVNYDLANNSGTSLIRLNNDGKVGINNISPSYTLDVNGTFRTTGGITSAGVTANAFKLTNTGSNNLYDVGTDNTYLNARVIFNNSSTVQDGLYIGFANALSGATRLYDGGSSNNISLSNGIFSSGGFTKFLFGTQSDDGTFAQFSGNVKFKNAVNITTGFNVTGNGGFYNGASKFGMDFYNGATRFYSNGANTSTKGNYEFHGMSSDGLIDNIQLSISSANTGITTTGAINRGTVNIGFPTTLSTSSLFVNTQSLNSGYNSGLGIDGDYSTATSAGNSIINIKAFGLQSGGGYESNLAFWTGLDGTLTEKVRILSNGNMGIGTKNPLGTLQIGNYNNGLTNDLVLFAPSNGIATGNSIKFDMNVGGGVTRSRLAEIQSISYQGAGYNQLRFNLGVWSNNVVTTNVLTLQDNGYVGIGTTNPTSTLHNNGSEANSIIAISVATTLADNYYVVANGTSTYLVALPTASTCVGRTYAIKTVTANKTISAFLNSSGTSTTTLTAGTVIYIVSDGTNWQQF